MRVFIILLMVSSLLISCQSTIFRPMKGITYNPIYVKKSVEDFAITTTDNTTLHAWRIKTTVKERKGAILFFHGNGGNIGSEVFQLLWVLDYGYDIFLADYRGYGFSQGKATIDNLLSDSLDIMDAFIELYDNETDIIVIGQSLGGQASAYVASNSQYADKIDLLILDSTFTTWRSVAKEISSSFFLTWPFQSLIALNFPKDSGAVEFIKRSKARNLLLLHSVDDRLISYKNSERIYEEALKNSSIKSVKFEKFEKISHAEILFEIKNRKLLLDLLDMFLKNKGVDR